MDFPKLYSSNPFESPTAEKEEDQEEQEDDEGGSGETFGVILSRSRSVPFATTSILALRAEKEIKYYSPLENAVKRAFSLRRSSSVSTSTGYYKVFHHCDLPEPEEADSAAAHNEMMNVVERKSRKKKAKIFEACRRLIHRVLLA